MECWSVGVLECWSVGWWGEAPERGQDIGNTFGGGTSVYRTLARATKNVCVPSVVLFPSRRCERPRRGLKSQAHSTLQVPPPGPAYNACLRGEPRILCMQPVTYVLAMFVTYVLASGPPERPDDSTEATDMIVGSTEVLRGFAPVARKANDRLFRFFLALWL